ncbi:hypothetical protein NHX12_003153 [Muraenolepis orangiensis]|uniref:Uridylate-specific endoribonuclease n=1 Tax=Muraenolepis orangiensis TaxID=630683 RepID=A0A9Q0DY80_9TELE|nr:hypothetical protein NHX12_003153 [Muraenolepis orangiensis]
MAASRFHRGLVLLAVFVSGLKASRLTVNTELSALFNEFWTLDVNRMQPGVDYSILVQGKAGYVNQGVHVVRENNLFLDAVMGTAVMKRAHRYLVGKGKSNSDLRLFKSQLYLIWFRLYHRQRNAGMDSSGFEHVFVGETKSGAEIIGFHNWLQFYLQEKHGHLDYKGYKAREQDIPDQDDHVLNLQFSWHGLVKPVGSAFVGASPEFEMALFTVVFLMNTDRSSTVLVNIDQCQMELVVIRHGRSLGTAYPRLLSSNSRHLPRSQPH